MLLFSVTAILLPALTLAAQPKCTDFQFNSTAAANLTCSGQGYLAKPVAIANYSGVSEGYGVACLSKCYDNIKCRGFSLQSSKTGKSINCTLYSQIPSRMGFTQDSSALQYYYAKDCYSCITCSNLKAPLVVNGDFADNPRKHAPLNIAPWTFEAEPSTGYALSLSGKSGYAVSATVPATSNGAYALVNQTIVDCGLAGKNYTVSFQYQYDHADDSSYVGFEIPILNQDQYVYLTSRPGKRLSNYTSVPFEWFGEQGGYLAVYFGTNNQTAGQTFSVTNIALTRVS